MTFNATLHANKLFAPTFIYVIHAFNKPDQVARLIKTLDSGNACFILNIDLKSDINQFPTGEKIYYVKQRHNISWGGISQVEQTINSIQFIESLGFTDYAHVIFLSEYCYPIKSMAKIERYLLKNQDKSFLLYYKIDKDSTYRTPIERLNTRFINDLIKYDRKNKWHNFIIKSYNKYFANFFSIKNVNENGKFVNFHNYQLYTGSNWMILNRAAIQYILSFMSSQGEEYMKIYKYAHCPDESFFHTILLNSELKEQITKNHHRHIDWSDKSEWPRFLVKKDLPTLIKKSKTNSLFARKFDSARCGEILDLIDEQLLKE